MKIGYMGFGMWGCTLATLLARKGYAVTVWVRNKQQLEELCKQRRHAAFPDVHLPETFHFTGDLQETLSSADIWVESVSSRGVRPLCEQIKALSIPLKPLVLTSKGIEQHTGATLSDVAKEILGESLDIGMLSGPGYAEEIIHALPASLVAASSNSAWSENISSLFTTDTLRIYPNQDIRGVSLGGALKNIFAIACGISDGLGYGNSARAALMTRGLHEMVKLGAVFGCSIETLYGLSGMGDLFLTCSSTLSRNYRFGYYLAEGDPVLDAEKRVGTVVEGHYTCRAAFDLSQRHQIKMPITETLYRVLFENLPVKAALPLLMQRTIKKEAL